MGYPGGKEPVRVPKAPRGGELEVQRPPPTDHRGFTAAHSPETSDHATLLTVLVRKYLVLSLVRLTLSLDEMSGATRRPGT